MTQPPPHRVLCCWDRALGDALLGNLPSTAAVDWATPTRDLLLHQLANYDAYLATLHVRLDADMIARAAAGRLRVVGTPSTGHDHLDVDALTRAGVQLLSLRSEPHLLEKVTSTAELAWALLLSVAHTLPAAHAEAVRGNSARDRFRGTQLSGKTLGIIGVGRLGRMVARYGHAFGMRVLGCDIRPLDEPNLQQVTLDTLLRESDAVSIHVHLTPETRDLISVREFSLMKPGVILINTSRGAIINEPAFLRALQTGRLAGAGVDVIDGEWNADLQNHPLIQYARANTNLIITPHIGGVTREAQTITHAHLANAVAAALQPAKPRPASHP